MSTKIYEKGAITVTRFYGGIKVGMCFQITDNSTCGIVVLTAQEMHDFLWEMKQCLNVT